MGGQSATPDVGYVLTEDPADPCSYCVNWVDDPDAEEWEQKMIPLVAPGVVATRLCTPPHARCLQMVADYEAEHAGDPD